MAKSTTRDKLAPMRIGARIDQLRALFGAAQCDALLVTKTENVRYLTGFTGSAAMLAVTKKNAVFVSDSRYRDQASEQLEVAGVQAKVEIGRPDVQFDALAKVLRPSRHIGLESDNVSWSMMTRCADKFGDKLVATRGLIEQLRVVKDEGELARLERACEIADIAFAQVKGRLAEEVSENDFAAELEHEMRRRGASGPSFETIIASGPNSAMPHARPSDRIVREGDLVVIDFGATFDGYHSDMTRTIYLGEPDRSTRELIDAVLMSQRAGLRAVKAGVGAASIDEACRTSLTEAGFGEAFLHSTGHGIGLQIHEAPAVAAGSTDSLPVNAVIAVEPGAYLTGRGGVRIEDSVQVTEDGGRVLTKSTKDFTL